MVEVAEKILPLDELEEREQLRKTIDKLKFEVTMQVKSISTLRAQDSAVSSMEMQVHELDQKLLKAKFQHQQAISTLDVSFFSLCHLCFVTVCDPREPAARGLLQKDVAQKSKKVHPVRQLQHAVDSV